MKFPGTQAKSYNKHKIKRFIICCFRARPTKKPDPDEDLLEYKFVLNSYAVPYK